MLKHTKRQVRYYESQLYNAFVISDVCNRSLCVIPFKTDMAKNQEDLRHEITELFFGRDQFRIHGQFLKVSAQHLLKTTKTRKQGVFNLNDSSR